jgi:hypothetical protein
MTFAPHFLDCLTVEDGIHVVLKRRQPTTNLGRVTSQKNEDLYLLII